MLVVKVGCVVMTRSTFLRFRAKIFHLASQREGRDVLGHPTSGIFIHKGRKIVMK